MPAKRRKPGPGDPRHGTPPGYYAGCRCRPCIDANRHRRWDQARERERQVNEGTLVVPHGLNGYYNYSCRCPICLEAAVNGRIAAKATAKAKKEKEISHDES